VFFDDVHERSSHFFPCSNIASFFSDFITVATNGAIWNNLSFGSFPLLPSIHFVEQFATDWMPDGGQFPLTFLIIPALVGATIVGSFERRIKGWLESKKE